MLQQQSIHAELVRLAGSGAVREQVPFRTLTTMQVGGPAALLVEPSDAEAAQSVVRFLSDEGILWTVMGNGSNLIVADVGFDGVVLRIAERLSDISVRGERLACAGGALLQTASRIALEHSLAGIEFASGIPGTVGGAVSMNAGAYGGEMKHVVMTSHCLDRIGNERILSGSEHDFAYRGSLVQQESLIVLSTWIQLEDGDRAIILERMQDYAGRRRDKQPLSMPSAGSVFKRPPGQFAGQLIEESGLRGFRIGGAQVSEKHCGFIVNAGGATCSDILSLIGHIIRTVQDRTGIRLEPEVRILGDCSKSGTGLLDGCTACDSLSPAGHDETSRHGGDL